HRMEQPCANARRAVVGLVVLSLGADPLQVALDLGRAVAERATHSIHALRDRIRQRLGARALESLGAAPELSDRATAFVLGDSQARVLGEQCALPPRAERRIEMALERPEESRDQQAGESNCCLVPASVRSELAGDRVTLRFGLPELRFSGGEHL